MMFLLPKLEVLQQDEAVIRRFGGLNTHAVIEDGELADCANISTEELPALTVCNPWEPIKTVAPKENVTLIACGQTMVELYRGSPNRLIRHRILPNGAESTNTITPAVGAELLEVSEFREQPVVLLRQAGQYLLYVYNDDGTLAQSAELTALFDGTSPTFLGLFPFGKRMVLIQDDKLHISFHDDLTRWQDYLINFEQVPTAAQQISIGEGGDFTGGIRYNNKLIVFKSGSLYELYGTSVPFSFFKIADIGCINRKSIASCNGVLYFLSEHGVMAYNGGLPKLVSADCPSLADEVCDSTAGSDGRYYYIGSYYYDTQEGVWGKMRATAVNSVCYFNGAVYYLQRKSIDGVQRDQISRYHPRRFDSTLEPEEWFFVTKRFQEEHSHQKQLSKLYICVEPQQPVDINIWISTDDSEWKQLYTAHLTQAGRQKILLRVPPCESYQFKISGKGKVTIPYIKRLYRLIPDGKLHPFS